MPEQSQLDQLIQYFFLLTKNQFRTVFGETEATNLTSQFETTFQELFVANKEAMPDALAQRHGVNAIFVMALHQVLTPQGYSYDELKRMVLDIYRAMLGDIYSQQAKQLELSPEPWKDFVIGAKIGNQQQYQNDYFQLQEIADDDTQFGFDMHKCLYFDMLQKNGLSALGTILCE